MTSTNMFQGLDNGSKPSSRVLRPPGGGSSNLFGGYEEDPSPVRRHQKPSSTIFASTDDPQGGPKRTNPPGGRSSGIFGNSEASPTQQKTPPQRGAFSNIFGEAESAPCLKPHPNKPKDNISVGASDTPKPQVSKPKEMPVEEKAPPQAKPIQADVPSPKVEPVSSPSNQPQLKDHEPHLGPRPRSHNKVLNPPGGKSSVVFY